MQPEQIQKDPFLWIDDPLLMILSDPVATGKVVDKPVDARALQIQIFGSILQAAHA